MGFGLASSFMGKLNPKVRYWCRAFFFFFSYMNDVSRILHKEEDKLVKHQCLWFRVKVTFLCSSGKGSLTSPRWGQPIDHFLEISQSYFHSEIVYQQCTLFFFWKKKEEAVREIMTQICFGCSWKGCRTHPWAFAGIYGGISGRHPWGAAWRLCSL